LVVWSGGNLQASEAKECRNVSQVRVSTARDSGPPKKGFGHLTFKKPDRVDALNAILAKHFPNALAAPR
jgi:hypothetical protein